MIFITVGTHEQPFDRLLECIDKMVEKGLINEEIICQKGYTEYMPKNYKAEKLIPYEQMEENINLVEEKHKMSGLHAQCLLLGLPKGVYDIYVLYRNNDNDMLVSTLIPVEI